MLLYVVFVFCFSSRSLHAICALVTVVQTCALPICLDAMTIAVPNAATHAPTPQKADPTRLDPVRVMNRAAENAIAAMYRLSAIGARKAFDRISRIALIRPPWCDVITAQAPSNDRVVVPRVVSGRPLAPAFFRRSEEHTSELQSLMRISYAVFCLQ